MRYGIPYKGSKNSIAQWVVDNLPKSETLVDLFAGGCAITHCALLSKKYKHIICNDVNDTPQLFVDAANGKYADVTEWISKDEFKKRAATDIYIRNIWSFGDNGVDYLYGAKYEAYKRAYHYAVVFGDLKPFSELGLNMPECDIPTDTWEQRQARRLFYQRYISAHHDEIKKIYAKWLTERQSAKKAEYERLESKIGNIDEAIENESERLRLWLCDALNKAHMKQSELDRHLGTQMSRHYFGKSQWAFPSKTEYEKIQQLLPLKESYEVATQHLRILQKLHALGVDDSLQSLQSLQSLERLERLQNLQRLEKKGGAVEACIDVFKGDYSAVAISRNATIYCDIPYRSTNCGHYEGFDWERFYDWVRAYPQPIYISEYTMPDDFVRVAAKVKRNLLSPHHKKEIEGLWLHKKWADAHRVTTLFAE